MIRILLADDHPIVLNGLEQLFRDYHEFDVVGRCSSGEQVVPEVERLDPDVLLLDIRMPRQDGIAVLRELSAKRCRVRTVVVTAALDEDEVLEAIRLGVRGVVLKEMPPRLLLECVRKVHEGGQWIEKTSVAKALDRMIRLEEGIQSARSALTAREVEIVRMVSSGLRNKEIADRLSISEGTVKVHLHSVYQKLQVDGRMELMVYARKHGLD